MRLVLRAIDVTQATTKISPATPPQTRESELWSMCSTDPSSGFCLLPYFRIDILVAFTNNAHSLFHRAGMQAQIHTHTHRQQLTASNTMALRMPIVVNDFGMQITHIHRSHVSQYIYQRANTRVETFLSSQVCFCLVGKFAHLMPHLNFDSYFSRPRNTTQNIRRSLHIFFTSHSV